MHRRILAYTLLYAALMGVGLLTAPGCVDLSNIEDTVRDTIRDEFREDEENLGDCRKYPAVSITNGSLVENCTFGIADRKYTCVSGTETTESFYESLESFVKEDDRLFRDRAEWSRITDGSNVTIVLYTRNANNQVTNQLYQQIEPSSSEIQSVTYTSWDGSNRPTAGTRSDSSCTNQNISIAYDGDARTKTETFSGGSSCTASTKVTTLDSRGLVISVVENFTDTGATNTDLVENTDIGEVCEKQGVPEPPVAATAGTLSFYLESAGQSLNIQAFSGSTLIAATNGDVPVTQDEIITLESVNDDGSTTGTDASLEAGNYDIYLKFIGDSTGGLVSYSVNGDKIYSIDAADYADGLIDPSVDWGITATGDCSWLRIGASETDAAAEFATCNGAAATNCATTGVNLVPTAYDVYCTANDGTDDFSGWLSAYQFTASGSNEDITLTEVP